MSVFFFKFECSFVHITDYRDYKHAATISSLRSTFVRFYRGLFIILLFPELSPPITKKYFQIKLSCVVEDDEKLTHIIEADQFSFTSHAIKLIRKPVKIAGFFP